ncbi:MAG: glycine--tRNA ligase subunit beta [Proteobacteria bacterium]|nr:glycine--tRNA ligase subunit beta [Pseudomonadota bacterium]
MSELFIAVRCEELPARFVALATKQLAQRMTKKLTGISIGEVSTWSTPRRIALSIKDVASQTPVEEKTITGPPVAAAYRDGKPTKAALGFAKSRGKDVSDLITVESKRGPVIGLNITTGGEKTIDRVADCLEEVILGMDFPKSMRWGSHSFSWARPIHNVVALYDGALIKAKIGTCETNDTTVGHRLNAKPLQISSSQDWISQLYTHWVIASKEDRTREIVQQLERKAKQLSSEVGSWELVDEVVNLVEWPVTISGEFPAELLDLPPRLLVEAMKIHQRVFPLFKNNKLTNQFLAVTNQPFATEEDVAANIAEGNKRVLTARFYDAQFFYAEDRKKSLDDHGEKLAGMRWVRKGGTVADKVNRIAYNAVQMASHFDADPKLVERAAQLCKNDLCTQMVYEFPELQGHVGRLLAELDGECSEIAMAIEEHYLPRFAEDELPSSSTSKAVAFADRWDTLSRCFALGLQPKGSGDPLGLRRAANGLIQILLQHQKDIDLQELCNTLHNQDANQQSQDTSAHSALLDFLLVRLRSQLQEKHPTEIVNACMTACVARSVFNPVAIQKRSVALSKLAEDEQNFLTIRTTLKRLMGLGRKATSSEYSPDVFTSPAETKLHEAFLQTSTKVDEALKAGLVDEALNALVTLKPAVDDLFESVMVMDEDLKVRNNRLSFLKSIADAFMQIADFTALSSD